MSAYRTTEEFRAQSGNGFFKLTNDFETEPYSGKYVRDINFTPDDLRMPNLAICRIFSTREDAETILRALQNK